MTSPTEVIDLARRGEAPPGWRVFTKRRNPVGAFFRGTRGDPDPMLVITTEAAVEYVNEKASLAVLHFGHVAQAKLRARATAMQGSSSSQPHASLHLWVDVTLTDGREVKWQTASFRNNVRVMQRFCEGCAVYAFWRRMSPGGYGPPGG
jgi:hypothetical protein